MKVNLIDITSATSSGNVSIQNTNNDALAAAIEKTLSRDGTSPNEMNANLDMNSNRILNLPAPINPSEPVRLLDLQNATFVEGDGDGEPVEDEIVELGVTFQDISVLEIDSDINIFKTIGYYSDDASGAAFMRRVSSQPSTTGSWTQDATGAYWNIDPGQDINIRMFGARSANADNQTQIQNCINYCQTNTKITHVPKGTYTVLSKLYYQDGTILLGEGFGSIILANFSGYVIERSGGNQGRTPYGPIVIEKLKIQNDHTSGNGIWFVDQIQGNINDCQIRVKNIGIRLGPNNFTAFINGTTVHGVTQAGSIGILAESHVDIAGCDICHWDTAVRKFGQSGKLSASRMEVNVVGVMIGRDASASPYWARGFIVTGNAFEANDYAIVARQAEGCSIIANVVQGTSNAPSGGSIVGYDLQQFNGCTVSGNSVTGEFATAVLRALDVWDSSIVAGNYFNQSGAGVVYSSAYSHVNSGVEYNRGILNNYGNAQTIATGSKPAVSGTDGTDTTPSTTETYFCVIRIDRPTIITGIQLLNGSAVAGNVTVGLADRVAAPISAAKSASTAQSGTNQYQRIPFVAAYTAVPGEYYVVVQFSSTSARFRTHAFGGFGAEKVTGTTYGTFPTGTDATTFTANVGPIASLY